MHCYRGNTEDWFKFLGVTSREHKANYPFEVINLDPKNPIMKDFGENVANAGRRALHHREALADGQAAGTRDESRHEKQRGLHLDQSVREGARLRHHRRPPQLGNVRSRVSELCDARTVVVGRQARRPTFQAGCGYRSCHRAEHRDSVAEPLSRPALSVGALTCRGTDLMLRLPSHC